MQLHTLACRVFVKPEDDAQAVKAAFLRFFPFSLEEQKVVLTTEHVQGFEQTIDILRVRLDKQRHLTAFMKRFIDTLSIDDLQQVVLQRESRLDEDNMLYIRLDKKSWLDGKAALTDSGDCFHFTLEIAAFPKNRRNVLENVGKIFNKDTAED